MSAPRGLGVIAKGGEVFMYSLPFQKKGGLQIDVSLNGFEFKKLDSDFEIKIQKGKSENLKNLKDFRVSQLEKKYLLTYLKSYKGKTVLALASSKDLVNWQKITQIAEISTPAMLVPEAKFKGKYTLLFGNGEIGIASSKNLKNWEIVKKPLIKPNGKLKKLLLPANIITTSAGIQLIYYEVSNVKKEKTYAIKTALFAKNNLHKRLWEPEKSIWETQGSPKSLQPLGVVNFGGRLISYWQSELGILAYELPPIQEVLELKEFIPPIVLNRIQENPMLSPIIKHFWESKAVFNPAAFYEGGKVHIIYRAIGDSDTSVLGYAISQDGIHIDERHADPVYIPKEHFECADPKSPICSLAFISGGGGGGGCEDPRIMKIKNRFYMTYVAYDGRNPPRIALTSIKDEDFLNRQFSKWEKPVLISPPGVIDKNASIFPEKVKGKYVFFHRIYPDILIDYVDSLEFDGKTKWLTGQHKITPVENSWDSRKVGVGPPPIKTKDGWLVIYQAVDDKDASQYKMGAMLLDLEEPTQVIARSKRPILTPDKWYENEGHKSGVVYPCGAVNKDGELLIYYGGADTVVCGARANLNEFVDQLKYSGSAQLTPINSTPIYS